MEKCEGGEARRREGKGKTGPSFIRRFDKCVRSRSGRIKKKMGRGFEGGIMQLGGYSEKVVTRSWWFDRRMQLCFAFELEFNRLFIRIIGGKDLNLRFVCFILLLDSCK